MYPKNSGGCSKFPGRLKLRPSIAQTAFVRVVTPRQSKAKQIRPALDTQVKCKHILNWSYGLV